MSEVCTRKSVNESGHYTTEQICDFLQLLQHLALDDKNDSNWAKAFQDTTRFDEKQTWLRARLLARKLGVPDGREGFLAAQFFVLQREGLDFPELVVRMRSDLKKIIADSGRKNDLLGLYERRVHRVLSHSPTGRILEIIDNDNNDVSVEHDRWLDISTLSKKWPKLILDSPYWNCIESPLPGVRDMPMEKLWVDVTLKSLGNNKLSTYLDSQAWQDLSFDREGVGFSIEEVLLQIRGLTVIYGQPGAGKSTLVKWIARYIVIERDSPYTIPVVVNLRQYAVEKLHRPDLSIFEYFLESLGVKDSSKLQRWRSVLAGLIDPPSSMIELMHSVLWVLDGWDEVPVDAKDLVMKEISSMALYPSILTTRHCGDSAKLPAKISYEIQGLKKDSALAFAHQWLSYNDKDIYYSAVEEAIEASPDLKRMVRSPFLLTLFCGLISQGFLESKSMKLKKRGDILKETLRLIYLQHNEDSKHKEKFYSGDRKQMASFAHWLLVSAPDFPRYVFTCEDYCNAGGSSERFQTLLVPSRIISRPSDEYDFYQFLHANFQEYLAAYSLMNEPENLIGMKELFYASCLKEVGRFLVGEINQEDPSWNILWCQAREMARNFDEFGIIATRLATWLAAAGGINDGGMSLLGYDVREHLWEVLVRYPAQVPTSLIEAYLELDPTGFAKKILDFKISSGKNSTVTYWLEKIPFFELKPLLEIPLYRDLLNQEEVRFRGELPQDILDEDDSNWLDLMQKSVEEKDFNQARQTFWRGRDEDVDTLLEGILVISDLAPEQCGSILLGIIFSAEFCDLVRGAAVTELIAHGDRSSCNTMIIYLATTSIDDPCVFAIMANMEGYMLDECEVELVLDFVVHCSDSEIRSMAAQLLINSRSARVAPFLVRAFETEEDIDVKKSILETLLEVGDYFVLMRLYEMQELAITDEVIYEYWIRVVLSILNEVKLKGSVFGESSESDYWKVESGMLELLNSSTQNVLSEVMQMVFFEFPILLGDKAQEMISRAITNVKLGCEIRIEAIRAVSRLGSMELVSVVSQIAKDTEASRRLREEASGVLGQMKPSILPQIGTLEAREAMAKLAFRQEYLFFDDVIIDGNGKMIDSFGVCNVTQKTIMNMPFKADVAVYIALEEEFDVFLKYSEEILGSSWTSWDDESKSVTYYGIEAKRGNNAHNTRMVAVCANAMGSDRAANISSSILEKFNPRILVSIGIGGSMSDDILMADVVFPNEVFGYFANSTAVDLAESEGWTFNLSGKHYPCDSHLLNQVAQMKRRYPALTSKWEDLARTAMSGLGDVLHREAIASGVARETPKIVFGDHVLASGPSVGKSEAFSKWLQKTNRKAHVLEMETSAVFDTGVTMIDPPRLLAIRGISDFADERKTKVENRYAGKFRTIAMENATRYFLLMEEVGILRL